MINIDLIRGLCVPNKGLGGYDLVNLKAHLEQPPNSNKGLFWDPPKLIGAQAIVRVGTVNNKLKDANGTVGDSLETKMEELGGLKSSLDNMFVCIMGAIILFMQVTPIYVNLISNYY